MERAGTAPGPEGGSERVSGHACARSHLGEDAGAPNTQRPQSRCGSAAHGELGAQEKPNTRPASRVSPHQGIAQGYLMQDPVGTDFSEVMGASPPISCPRP